METIEVKPSITINLASEHARLTDVALLLHEINERLCYLYERDCVYVDSRALYEKLVAFNDDLLLKIGDKITATQSFSSGTIARLKKEIVVEDDMGELPYLQLLQDIEIKLCEVCDRYEAMLDHNPYATSILKEYFKPFKIQIVGFVKSSRRIIYSYC